MKDETTDLPSKVRDYLKQVYPGYSLCVQRTCWTFGLLEKNVYAITVFPIADNNHFCVNFEDEELSIVLSKLFRTMALAGVRVVSKDFCVWTDVRPATYNDLLVQGKLRANWPVESHTLYDFLHLNTTQP